MRVKHTSQYFFRCCAAAVALLSTTQQARNFTACAEADPKAVMLQAGWACACRVQSGWTGCREKKAQRTVSNPQRSSE